MGVKGSERVSGWEGLPRLVEGRKDGREIRPEVLQNFLIDPLVDGACCDCSRGHYAQVSELHLGNRDILPRRVLFAHTLDMNIMILRLSVALAG